MSRHIAVLNFTRMGDLIQSGPLMRALVSAEPDSHLTLIVYEGFRQVAERLPMVDTVIALDAERLTAALDARHGSLRDAYAYLEELLADHRLSGIDEIYNLAHTPLSAALCGLLSPARIHGMQRTPSGSTTITGEWIQYLLSIMQERRLSPFNLGEIYLRLAGPKGKTLGLEFKVTNEDRAAAAALFNRAGVSQSDRIVVLQPGASGPSRQWPPAAFAELAFHLSNHGMRPVLVGSQGEQSIGRQILDKPCARLISLMGNTTIGTLAAVLERAEKLVSNDTGTIHLAAAVGTPTIGIFLGPASAKDTAPYGTGHIILEPDLACAPCSYQHACHHFQCHQCIIPSQVMDLIEASDQDVAEVAARMTNVRVLMTHLGSDGTLTIERLSVPGLIADDHLLSFYRHFWDALLNNVRFDGHLSFSGDVSGIAILRTILADAQDCFAAVQAELRKPTPSAETVNALLRNQQNWHRALQNFIGEYPALAPLPRFLLVRATSMHADALSEHLRDIRVTLSLFERGVQLLEAAYRRTSIHRTAHVATA